MTLPSIFISWTSATPATGDATPTSATSAADLSCMNAPVAFCAGDGAADPRVHDGDLRERGGRRGERQAMTMLRASCMAIP
jgi:hypothetical protein